MRVLLLVCVCLAALSCVKAATSSNDDPTYYEAFYSDSACTQSTTIASGVSCVVPPLYSCLKATGPTNAYVKFIPNGDTQVTLLTYVVDNCEGNMTIRDINLDQCYNWADSYYFKLSYSNLCAGTTVASASSTINQASTSTTSKPIFETSAGSGEIITASASSTSTTGGGMTTGKDPIYYEAFYSDASCRTRTVIENAGNCVVPPLYSCVKSSGVNIWVILVPGDNKQMSILEFTAPNCNGSMTATDYFNLDECYNWHDVFYVKFSLSNICPAETASTSSASGSISATSTTGSSTTGVKVTVILSMSGDPTAFNVTSFKLALADILHINVALIQVNIAGSNVTGSTRAVLANFEVNVTFATPVTAQTANLVNNTYIAEQIEAASNNASSPLAISLASSGSTVTSVNTTVTPTASTSTTTTSKGSGASATVATNGPTPASSSTTTGQSSDAIHFSMSFFVLAISILLLL